MNYIPTEWSSGDIVTAEKLNKIEQGIGDAFNDKIFLINVINNNLDKTWNEINTAVRNGKIAIIKEITDDSKIEFGMVVRVSTQNSRYTIGVSRMLGTVSLDNEQPFVIYETYNDPDTYPTIL